MSDIVERLYNRQVCSPPQNACRNDWICDEAAAELTRLRIDLAEAREAMRAQDNLTAVAAQNLTNLAIELAEAQRERDEAHNWTATVERHGTDNFDALAEQWCAKSFIQRLIRAGSSVFAKWANDELTKRHHRLVSDIAHQAFVEGALCGVRAEMAKGAADRDAAKAEAERLREAIDAIHIYADDTLSGRADGPTTREWLREGIVEIRKRARAALQEKPHD